ncbi:TfoX/Sxy family protein [Paracoccaceae bacterium Fryx2]|nr:TfoX/Sxy family protein [Paracoccaceae bacterium Fryx2]
MATHPDTMTYICDQLQGAGRIRAVRMFGEYAVCCDDKVVALICDNTLFLKATPGARALIPDADLAPPYPGAKPCLRVDDAINDAALLARTIAAIMADLPPPKPKKPKAR